MIDLATKAGALRFAELWLAEALGIVETVDVTSTERMQA